MPSSEWHWEQGIKYAIEGIKTGLLLNGAAGITLFTYLGRHSISRAMISAITLFALGAMLAALGFYASYMTQLEYGNAELHKSPNKEVVWQNGQRWNGRAINLALASVGAFAVGTILVACGLL